MASIPCAAYKAGHIHDHLRKQNICQQRKAKLAQMIGESSSRESTPPPSPKTQNDTGFLKGVFVYLNSKRAAAKPDPNWGAGSQSVNPMSNMPVSGVPVAHGTDSQ